MRLRWLKPGLSLLFSGLWLALLLGSVSHVQAGERLNMQLFQANSYPMIRSQNAEQRFLMVFWSLDCPPCIEELPLLGQFHQQHPQARMILVSTDGPNQLAHIEQLLRQHGLTDVQHWVFSDQDSKAIRYAIDPLWYGELPRSYFHEQDQRQAISGRLDQQLLKRWFKPLKKQSKVF